jgi:ribonucleoside-triphosphate reductase
LAPFVDVSRKKIREEVRKELLPVYDKIEDELEYMIEEITEKRVRAEVKRGVQTIQYQVNTLLTTNGQAPFITVFMYLNEVEDEQTKKDLAMVIEEVLLQRTEGIKNEKGVWVSPAFPKLVYVLEEDNVYPDSEYWYLTKLAAKCTAKRLVPDYISEKIMKELKEGGCFAPMGCRSCLSPWYDETIIQPNDEFELV